MRAKAIYRALLYCYPAAFRHEYGNQMTLLFADQLRDARRRGRPLEQAALWGRAVLDVLTVAVREHLQVVAQDMRYALRTMAARPGFSSVAILSLALGIGANAAIFSLWNGVLRSPLPAVARPEQLVMLSNPDESGMWTGRWNGRTDGPRSWLTFGEFEALRDHADCFSELMASQSSLGSWQVRIERGGWEEARGRLVSGEFFQLLGVRAALGRVFTGAEDMSELPSIVISHNYWRRRFGGRPDVLGTSLTIRETALTIVGVAPPGFVGETNGQDPDLWLPIRLQPRVLPGRDWLHDSPPEKVMWLNVFGRLKPGVTQAQAEARANAIFQAGLESFYGAAAQGERRRDYLDQRLRLRPGGRGASPMRSEFSDSLTALLAAVGVLLLIACANLANLLLARGAARRSEIALRLSLGARRERLIRQLLTESLALAAIGGAAAIGVAYVLHAALVRMVAESDPRFHVSFVIDPAVVAFIVGVTLASTLLFGVLPAWQVTRTDAGVSLKEDSRGGTFRGMRSGRLLVGLQLALSLPLLVGAGLLARTAYNVQRADLGYAPRGLVLARVDLREAGYDVAQRAAVLRGLVDEIRRIPGVRSVSYSQLGLFSGGESGSTIEVEGYVPKGDHDRESALDVIGPGYFSTLGIPIVLGREILERDRADAMKVSVINEAFARRFFDRRNPIGMRITSVGDPKRTTYQIVGIARNARTKTLRGDIEPRFFVATVQTSENATSPTLLIRSAGDSSAVIAGVRRTVERVDPALPIVSAFSMDDQMAPLTAQDRTTAQLAIVFACVALALAAIGLYGVLSYGVARRTREIAIRIALGARSSRVMAMILGEMIALVAAGLAAGGALAYAASRVIDSRLYGVAPQDPLTLVTATAVLLAVAASAALAPALRAARLNPIATLRAP